MNLIHLDADRTGSNSIAHLVQSGHVTTFSTPTLDLVARRIGEVKMALERRQIDPANTAIALDTLTRMTVDAREDIVVDPAKVDISRLWELRHGLKSSRDDFYSTMSLVNRILRALYDLPIPSILLAHERVRMDPLSGMDKYVPDLQDAINGTVFTSADMIARLTVAQMPMDYMSYKIQPGMRLLVTSPTGDSSAGGRAIPSHPLPPFLVGWRDYEPTFADLVNALGYFPHNTVIYGKPKLGKTTLAGSVVYI